MARLTCQEVALLIRIMTLLQTIIAELLANPKGIAEPEGRLIGYARVSTEDQKLDLQLDALKRAGVDADDIHVEKVSGVSKNRPAFESAMRALRPGDTLVVWRLDRVARSLRELLDKMHTLEKRKIGFKSLTESIDTGTAVGRLIMHVVGAIAEFERQLTIERTKAGMRARKDRGESVGAPRRMDVDKALQRLREGASIAEAAREQGYSRAALARYVSTTEAFALRAADELVKPKRKPAPKRRK